jgi:hypothetical protein
MSKQNVLVGKTLKGVKLAKDKEAILFVCDNENIVVKCDADCCSHTWVESIETPARGFPATVLSVEDIVLNDDKDNHGGELAFYGLKIVTESGDIIIDYRNESNGYYGGSLSWPGEDHYGGVYGQNNSKQEWEEA